MPILCQFNLYEFATFFLNKDRTATPPIFLTMLKKTQHWSGMASLYLKAKTDAIASLSPLRCDYFQIQTKNDSDYSEGSLFTVLALAMERFISVRK